MPDMLVRLWKLDYAALRQKTAEIERTGGVRIVRPLSPDFVRVRAFIQKEFGDGWASEAEASLYHDPVGCFIAVDAKNQLIGFACCNATCKGFFGPTGVVKKRRGEGIGSALLWRCMEALWEQDSAYAVIGGAGPVEYYSKSVGATVIEDSSPGIYSRRF